MKVQTRIVEMGYLVGTLKTFAQKFNNDWSMNLAGMLAYSLITAIFPILIAILSLAGIVLHFLSPTSLSNLAGYINGALPSQLHNIINPTQLLHQLVSITGPLAIVALVGLVWTGSNLFTNMENAFSIVFRTGDRDFVKQKLMAVGMVIVLAILLPVSLGASSLITSGTGFFASVLPSQLHVVLTVVGPLVSLATLWVLFLIIYIVVPNIKVPFRDAWRGALTAAVLFGIFDVLFPLYFKFFLSGNSKYGATAAALLVAVVWLWFFALITLIGAQVNAVAMGLKPTRYDVARTLCMDYKENTDPDDQEHIGQDRGVQPTAAPKQPPRERETEARASGGGISRAISAPLHAIALAGWLVARPFMRHKSDDTHHVDGVEDRPGRPGSAAS